MSWPRNTSADPVRGQQRVRQVALKGVDVEEIGRSITPGQCLKVSGGCARVSRKQASTAWSSGCNGGCELGSRHRLRILLAARRSLSRPERVARRVPVGATLRIWRGTPMSSNLERARELFPRGLTEHLATRWREAERPVSRSARARAGSPEPRVQSRPAHARPGEGRGSRAAVPASAAGFAPDDHEARYNLGVSLRSARALRGSARELRSCDRSQPDFRTPIRAGVSRWASSGATRRRWKVMRRSIELQPGSRTSN